MLPEVTSRGQRDVCPASPEGSLVECQPQDPGETQSARSSAPAEGDWHPDGHSSTTKRIDHALHTLKSELVCSLSTSHLPLYYFHSVSLALSSLSPSLSLSLSLSLSVSPLPLSFSYVKVYSHVRSNICKVSLIRLQTEKRTSVRYCQ